MDNIYTEAECVVVWLGDAAATDELALHLLKAVHAYCANPENTLDLSAEEVAFHWDASLSKVTQEHFDALAAFLLRPWFSRMWMYVSHKLFGTCV